jgi:small conductance mechanosensitive channel
MPIPDLSVLVASTIVPFVLKLVGAVALWIAGGWLIQMAMRILRKSLRHSSLDVTVVGYLINILAAVLRVILVVAILGFFGIQTASFAALLAGAGVAIGAAWSGMLGNFAAGVFLQIFRPFSVGDFITAAGITGTVEEIGMFVTSLLAPDNVRNIVPNGKLFGDTIQNYSVHGYRRVDLVAQLDNSADVARAIALLKEGLQRVPNQFEGMAADVEVLEFSERGPRLAVRPFTHTSTYWQVYFDTNRMIVEVLGSNGFPVPRIPVAMASSSVN